jgi:predicted MFS family arabinose efflux permease
MGLATPAERSAAVGAVVAFVDVALASGAFVLGVAARAAGYGAVFTAGAVSALVGLALVSRLGGWRAGVDAPRGERTATGRHARVLARPYENE